MRNKKLPKTKETAVAAVATKLHVPLKSTRTIERDRIGKDGKVEETIVENLATMELPDGSTITVDADSPDAEAIIEKARDRVEAQITKGTKVRKQK